MSEGQAELSGAGRISVEELDALNAEIAALVRAGVPLDGGVAGGGGDRGGGGGGISPAGGRGGGGGESLAAARGGERGPTPPLYRAVVEAGGRSGRLAIALEGL